MGWGQSLFGYDRTGDTHRAVTHGIQISSPTPPPAAGQPPRQPVTVA